MSLTLTRDGLLERFPHFENAPVELVTSALTSAAARTNDALFPEVETAETAAYLRAAITLYRSPFAIKMRLNSPESIMLAVEDLRQIQRTATMGLRVFGNPT